MIWFSFGISPTLDKMYHKGTMKTLLDDCQFVCIAQEDYHRILDKVSTVPVQVSAGVSLITHLWSIITHHEISKLLTKKSQFLFKYFWGFVNISLM